MLLEILFVLPPLRLIKLFSQMINWKITSLSRISLSGFTKVMIINDELSTSSPSSIINIFNHIFPFSSMKPDVNSSWNAVALAKPNGRVTIAWAKNSHIVVNIVFVFQCSPLKWRTILSFYSHWPVAQCRCLYLSCFFRRCSCLSFRRCSALKWSRTTERFVI